MVSEIWYKAQFQPGIGYPDAIPGLLPKLANPFPIGHAAGGLSAEWRERTGILGSAAVAVAVIDSHIVMPAVGAVEAGTLVGALGTSAAFLLLDDQQRPLPKGLEGVAKDGVLPGFWCYEAGQAGFGDMLDWFVSAFPRADQPAENFARYNAAAAALQPGQNHLIALDWWNGCRVPFGDASLSGMLLGFNLQITSAGIYRALLESLCFGARTIIEHMAAGGAPIQRILLTSGLSSNNPLLMQMMADVLGRTIQVPQIAHATAVGAAIHGAVASGVVSGYADGARRFGAASFADWHPNPATAATYGKLFAQYLALSHNTVVRHAMHVLND